MNAVRKLCVCFDYCHISSTSRIIGPKKILRERKKMRGRQGRREGRKKEIFDKEGGPFSFGVIVKVPLTLWAHLL
jgi:hypothetical protein